MKEQKESNFQRFGSLSIIKENKTKLNEEKEL